jgi:hypothetical protein
MKRVRTLLAVFLILGLVLIPLPGRGETARAAGVIYVDADAGGADDGSSWTDAYTDLQDALGAAGSGDEIWVAEGVYTPGSAGVLTATFQLESGVEVYGGFAGSETARDERDWQAHVTVLSGDIDANDVTDADGVVTDTGDIAGANAYHVVTGSGTDTTAVLDGFTITAGYAEYSLTPDSLGGGMFIFNGSPTLINLILRGNRARSAGGGMYIGGNSNPTLSDVGFHNNHAYQGGGMRNYGSAPTLIDVTFNENTAATGGGGMGNSESDPVLLGVTFSGNTVVSDGDGGGMYSYDSNPTLTDVVFTNNDAYRGGGMFNENDSDPVLTNVVFSGNTAGSSGGGMSSFINSDPALTNVVFSGNHSDDLGGGMYGYQSDAALTNVTFSGNTAVTGGGMRNYNGSYLALYNCVLWGNSATSSGDQIANLTSTPTIYYSLVQGSGGSGSGWDTDLGTDGGGNIDADPQFVDPDGADDTVGTLDDNLRLEGDSPAVDAGDNGWLVATSDLDYHVRRVDMPRADTGSGVAPIVDMGAYEAHVLYVDERAPQTSAEDGSSWADAYLIVQDALSAAAANTEIWVAQGVYHTDEVGMPKPDPAASFQLQNDVALYGGFTGTESAREQRDWQAHVTVLSGDIDGNDTRDAHGVVTDTTHIVGSNAYHVVDGSATTGSAVLDGFFITAGQADGTGANNDGAGIYISGGSPTLRNLVLSGNLADGPGGGIYSTGNPALTRVTFTGNAAGADGGGMHNDGGSPTFSDVVFSGNQAGNMGGGLYHLTGDATLTGVIFSGNDAEANGGGMVNYQGILTLVNGLFSGNSADNGGGLFNYQSDATLTNVTLSRNTATFPGGGLLNHDSGFVKLTNCILWENSSQVSNEAGATSIILYSLVQDGCPDGSTCDHLQFGDPRFVDPDGADDVSGTLDDDLRLRPDSPAIDAGSNTAVPGSVTTDLAGAARFVDVPSVLDTGGGSAPIVDVGAYEAAFEIVYLPLVLDGD